jgi:hypothetical protein
MATKTSLGDFAIWSPAENTSQMLQFIDDPGSGLDIFFDGVLIIEEIPTLDGIEHMLFPAVRLGIPQGGGNATLGGTRMRSGRINLCEHSNIQVFADFQSGPHSCKPSANDHHIMFNHRFPLNPPGIPDLHRNPGKIPLNKSVE